MYEPQINDYVIWKDHIEGWVYFKDKEYITIESWVRPKSEENYSACSIHKNNRLLILCYHNQWNELTYVKSRESVYEEVSPYIMETMVQSIGGESYK